MSVCVKMADVVAVSADADVVRLHDYDFGPVARVAGARPEAFVQMRDGRWFRGTVAAQDLAWMVREITAGRIWLETTGVRMGRRGRRARRRRTVP